MEHYGRVAYANLRFSRPSKGHTGLEDGPRAKHYIKLRTWALKKTDGCNAGMGGASVMR